MTNGSTSSPCGCPRSCGTAWPATSSGARDPPGTLARTMQANRIRGEFLRFFEERGHRIVPSSSLIPNDPTLLLSNAGMNQFKPYLLGIEEPPYARAATSQKVFRAVDIDNVGH